MATSVQLADRVSRCGVKRFSLASVAAHHEGAPFLDDRLRHGEDVHKPNIHLANATDQQYSHRDVRRGAKDLETVAHGVKNTQPATGVG